MEQLALQHELPKDYFKYQETCLYYMGISFTGNESTLYRILSTIWLISIVITYGVFELIEVYINMTNKDKLANLLSYFGTDILGVVNVAVLMHNRLSIGKILTRLQRGIFTPDVSRGGMFEIEIIRDYIASNNRQTYLYQTFSFTCVAVGIIGTLIKRIESSDPTKWELPFVPFSLLDLSRSPTYELIWLHQGVYRFFYCLIVTSAYTLISSTLAHISAQCRMLQNGFRKMAENVYNEAVARDESCRQDISSPQDINPRLLPSDILDRHLRKMIYYHWQIIDVSNEFEEIFTFLILCEFLATLCILCFAMYHASLFDLFSMRAIQDFSYVGAISTQVFLACYWGNEVQLQSQGVGDSCYEANFVGAHLHYQKSLAFIMRRCRNPIVLTAAKFTDLSLKTYMWLIRASYSYYMVLRSHNR